MILVKRIEEAYLFTMHKMVIKNSEVEFMRTEIMLHAAYSLRKNLKSTWKSAIPRLLKCMCVRIASKKKKTLFDAAISLYRNLKST